MTPTQAEIAYIFALFALELEAWSAADEFPLRGVNATSSVMLSRLLTNDRNADDFIEFLRHHRRPDLIPIVEAAKVNATILEMK